MKKHSKTIASACLIMGIAFFALPLGAQTEGLTIINPVLRMTIPGRPAAGYFTLQNATDKAFILVGVHSPACGKAMLHQSKMEDDVMKMEPVPELEVPAGGSIIFARGGYHVMCMKPAGGLRPGKTVLMELEFRGGMTLKADFAVTGAK